MGWGALVRVTLPPTDSPEPGFAPVRVIEVLGWGEVVFGGFVAAGFLPDWGLACGVVGRWAG